jgi:2-hydroxycyclohexanecarboxyl-CoA dehydrogenase
VRGLAGRAALVTGGAGGIGRAIAGRLAAEGCRVGVFDLAPNPELPSYPVDVTDRAAVAEALARFEAEAGPCDVLVNGAGWDAPRPFLDTDPTDWDKVLAINLRGALNLHHLVCPGMAARRRGRVVNIASDAARVGAGLTAVYAAAKGGLVAFTKSLARELAGDGVTLNVVSPGPTRTPLLEAAFAGDGERWLRSVEKSIPMKRIGEPEDVAGLVAFLASDDAAYITGQVISVSGGLTMAG